jgi:hypothetical protein
MKYVRMFFASIFGIIGGLLLFVGIYLYLTQAEVIAPTSKVGIAFPIAGVLLGLIVGIFGGRRKKKAAPATAPAAAPPPAPAPPPPAPPEAT